MYRDIKPDNIGFDVRGDVKIFDFGLAKEFDPAKSNPDGTYNYTGDTGSPRYMATEVAQERPYNQNVDVYSFCILLWEILTLSQPFENFTFSMLKRKVVEEGFRPKPDDKWPPAISNALRAGWGDAKKRPSMEEIHDVLRDEINRNSEEGVEDSVDISGKSAASLHRGSH
jgi:serine/threonine protein kinase